MTFKLQLVYFFVFRSDKKFHRHFSGLGDPGACDWCEESPRTFSDITKIEAGFNSVRTIGS